MSPQHFVSRARGNHGRKEGKTTSRVWGLSTVKGVSD